MYLPHFYDSAKSLNDFDRALVQPLVPVARMLDWVKLKLALLEGAEAQHGGDVCVCGCGCVSILVPMLQNYGAGVFLFPPEPK